MSSTFKKQMRELREYVRKDAMDDCVSAWIEYLANEEGKDPKDKQTQAEAYSKCENGESPPSK